MKFLFEYGKYHGIKSGLDCIKLSLRFVECSTVYVSSPFHPVNFLFEYNKYRGITIELDSIKLSLHQRVYHEERIFYLSSCQFFYPKVINTAVLRLGWVVLNNP